MTAGNLYVAEYAGTQFQGGNVTSPPQEISHDQVVAFNTATQSSAFQATTNLIACYVDSLTPCSVAVGVNPTATTTNKRLPSNSGPHFLGVQPGWKISAVSNT